MAKIKKAAAPKKTAKKASVRKIQPHFENGELIGEDGFIVRESHRQQIAGVIMPRDIREAITDDERNALDKKRYTEQLAQIKVLLGKKENTLRPDVMIHLKRLQKIVEGKLVQYG